MSKAKDVAQALTDRLAVITVANGYQTDIGLRVFRGRRKLDETHVPCIVIVEGDDNITSEQRGRVATAPDYFIEGHSVCDPDNPNDKAHDMIADLKRAIWSGDLSFGGLVLELKYKGRAIQSREDGMSMIAGSIQISAKFAENLAEP